jgi:predicted nucleotidyltransferase
MATLAFNTHALADVCRRNHITRLRLFGSYARDEAGAQSDIDLIADFTVPKSLFDLVRIEGELSTALGHRVDLLTETAISPYIRQRIRDDVRVIYETG